LVKINIKTISIGLVTYAILWILTYKVLFDSLRQIPSTDNQVLLFDLIWKYILCLPYIGAGFVAGYISKNKGMLYGFMVGILGALLVSGTAHYLSNYPVRGSSQLVWDLSLGVILCWLGGAVGQLIWKNR